MSGDQLAVVIAKVLPDELRARGIDDADTVCASLGERTGEIGDTPAAQDSPESLFARLGG